MNISKIKKDRVRQEIAKHPELQTKNFPQWFEANFKLVKIFLNTAENARVVRDFENYSARGILHVMRWEIGRQDHPNPLKISNTASARLARLYNALTGTSFFRTRDVDTWGAVV